MDTAIKDSKRPVHTIGSTRSLPTYKEDLRTGPPDKFIDLSQTDWSKLSWKDLGRPYLVDDNSRHKRAWERESGTKMPVPVQWEHFNRSFHQMFISNPQEEIRLALRRCLAGVTGLKPHEAFEALEDVVQMAVWNRAHRVEDAVWDPRGKRALFEGLPVTKPKILYLGAADGYEGMQLLAMYPGGHATLVDYDDFCRTDRFAKFPEAYPFLGQDPSTGNWCVHYREQMNIDFLVKDIKDLDFGQEFDVVVSIGLVEHFPDTHKPLAFEMHRRFLKPGGHCVITTPRRELRSKLFYMVMGEIMNYGYRELMDARQLALYAYENGFDILRCGWIKGHNGIICKPR